MQCSVVGGDHSRLDKFVSYFCIVSAIFPCWVLYLVLCLGFGIVWLIDHACLFSLQIFMMGLSVFDNGVRLL